MDSNDFITIIKYAWMEYDSSRRIKSIEDISAFVSTNHVYKISLIDGSIVIAKLSYFGKYDDFVEDHTIINVLSNNLPYPFENLLSRSLMKGNNIFIHRFKNELIDAAVVFYRPVKIKNRPPRQLNEEQIIKLGQQTAKFHRACHTVRHTIPPGSKSLRRDIALIEQYVHLDKSQEFNPEHKKLILDHCKIYIDIVDSLYLDEDNLIPVFIDWNIGNFSVTPSFRLYSRWDYDWFRITTRVMDFYFLSRVVSDVGDKTVFTYNVNTFNEDRFKLFLSSYHSVFPLIKDEIIMIKEGYRFFILNYVIRHGGYFFNTKYASKLKKEALEIHLPSIDQFDPNNLINFLEL